MNRGVRLATVAVRTVSLAQTFFEFHEFESVDFLLQPEREYKLSAWYTARQTCWGNVFFVGGILSTDLLLQQKSFPLILLTEVTGLVLSYKTTMSHSMFFLDLH